MQSSLPQLVPLGYVIVWRQRQAYASLVVCLCLIQCAALCLSSSISTSTQAICRQDVEDNSSGAELRAQLEQLQQERDESAQSLAITQSALADAQAESHQLQQAVHDLQRRKQDRGYEDLQARFNEVSCNSISPTHFLWFCHEASVLSIVHMHSLCVNHAAGRKLALL